MGGNWIYFHCIVQMLGKILFIFVVQEYQLKKHFLFVFPFSTLPPAVGRGKLNFDIFVLVYKQLNGALIKHSLLVNITNLLSYKKCGNALNEPLIKSLSSTFL